MRAAHADILAALRRADIRFGKYPALEGPACSRGIAAAKAFVMQGVLKYHGMTDWDWRIAYMPSVSVNNDAAYSITLVEFDPDLNADVATIGGMPAHGRPLERIIRSLDVVRQVADIRSHARVVSKNIVRASTMGKGLGTSASASAALATAAIAAVFGPQMVENFRFVSCLSRLMAGSGCRSATGGAALWLSHPGISHEDSFAVRLDNHNELEDLRLITIPLQSRIGLQTEFAHSEAPYSPFFQTWMRSRRDDVLESIAAVQNSDWQTLGRLAELDSIRLHSVTMSSSRENKIFAWEPENISLFRLCNNLRSEGVPVYFSTDTGPTTVLLTHKDFEEPVAKGLANIGMVPIHGRIAGPATVVDVNIASNELAV